MLKYKNIWLLTLKNFKSFEKLLKLFTFCIAFIVSSKIIFLILLNIFIKKQQNRYLCIFDITLSLVTKILELRQHKMKLLIYTYNPYSKVFEICRILKQIWESLKFLILCENIRQILKKLLKSCLKINKIILEFWEHFNKFNTIRTV